MEISVRLSKAEVLAKLTLLERYGLISYFQLQPVSIMKQEQRAALKLIKFLITKASGGFFQSLVTLSEHVQMTNSQHFSVKSMTCVLCRSISRCYLSGLLSHQPKPVAGSLVTLHW